MLRPLAIAGYEVNGERRLMPISEREIARAESFILRLLGSETLRRGSYALCIATMYDAADMIPFERVLAMKGLICCFSEASPYDGARIEAAIRRFDISLVAVVTGTVLDAIRSLGFDPVKLFQGKVVWASGEGYAQLKGAEGLDLRRWAHLGPALAIEGKHGAGAHVDGREWKIEPEGGATYVSSRLDRAQAFRRLRVDTTVKLNPEPCASGLFGPRILP